MDYLKELSFLVSLIFFLSCQNKEAQTNKSKNHHVWFSKRQSDYLLGSNQRTNQAILEDSTFVVYTELTKTKNPSGVWDDYIYLGKGSWHKVL